MTCMNVECIECDWSLITPRYKKINRCPKCGAATTTTYDDEGDKYD